MINKFINGGMMRWSTNIVIPDRMETICMGPIWVRCNSFHCTVSWGWFFEAYIMGFLVIVPSHEKKHVISLAIHGITFFQMIFGDIMGLCMHGIGGQSRLSQLPRHGYITRTIHTITIMIWSLTVWYFIVNPVMSSFLDCFAL